MSISWHRWMWRGCQSQSLSSIKQVAWTFRSVVWPTDAYRSQTEGLQINGKASDEQKHGHWEVKSGFLTELKWECSHGRLVAHWRTGKEMMRFAMPLETRYVSQDWDGTDMSSDKKMTTASNVCHRSWSVWTSESGKAEEDIDKHYLTRPHQPEPHTSGCGGSTQLEKKNQYGWPHTWGIHSLKKRERA